MKWRSCCLSHVNFAPFKEQQTRGPLRQSFGNISANLKNQRIYILLI